MHYYILNNWSASLKGNGHSLGKEILEKGSYRAKEPEFSLRHVESEVFLRLLGEQYWVGSFI